MAWNFKNEEDVKQYLENIKLEYSFSCFEERNAQSCHLWGDYLEAIKNNLQEAANIYKKNCDEFNYGHSCYKYANCCYLGKGLKKNEETALKYFLKACHNHYYDSCFIAGVLMYGNVNKRHENVSQISELLKESCEKQNGDSCYYLGSLYITDKNGLFAKDMKKAFEYMLKACNLENIYACCNVSQMFSRGEGITKNEELANKYKIKVKDLQKQLEGRYKNITFGNERFENK